MGKAIRSSCLWVKTERCGECEERKRAIASCYIAALPSPPGNLNDVCTHGVDELWGVKA